MKRKTLISCLLVLAMLLTLAIPVFGAGATFADDATAIAGGYSFKVGTSYYKTLAECYDAVEDGGTITMIANYENTTGCEKVGLNATASKTYTIEGGNFTYKSSKNHPLHFYQSNVTINQMNVEIAGDGGIAGPRIEYNSTVTIKNATWEKTGSSANDWNPAVIVYGTLILDEGAVIKNNGANAGSKNHAIWTEGKKQDANGTDVSDASIIPVVILKKGSSIEACNYVFYESTKAEIKVESYEVTLTSKTHTTGSVRRAIGGTIVTMSGPTFDDYSNETVKSAWKKLYEQLAQTWVDTPSVDEATIKTYKPTTAKPTVRMKDDSFGLRFTSTVSAEVIGFAKNLVSKNVMTTYSYGTLIVKQSDVASLTEISESALTGANIKFLKVSADKGLTNGTNDIFNAAMINIKEANYQVKFCAIAYITYVYAGEENKTLTVYSDVGEACSIEEAALTALADVSETVVSGCSNPVHSYYVLQDGKYVEVDGDRYSKYSKAQRETLLSFVKA